MPPRLAPTPHVLACHVDVATAEAAAVATAAMAAAPVAAAAAVAAIAVAAEAAVATVAAMAASPVAAAAVAAEPAATSTTGPCRTRPVHTPVRGSCRWAFVAGSGATSLPAKLSFTLDSGMASCFFRDSTDLTPLHTLVTVALADPSMRSVVAHSTTILPCLVAPSGFLTSYHTPSFSRNLVGISHLHDLRVVTNFPLDEPVASCTIGATGVPLATPATRSRALGRGIIKSYTLPDSPQQNEVAERRISLVMEVARTSMCHASAPQVLWPQAVRYAVHQLNLWPSDARPRVPPVSLWTGSLGVAADYRVWGSLAHVRAPGANNLSPRTRACVFLGFPLDTSGWQFYDPVTCQFFSSQDVTFDESVSYYRSRSHRSYEAFSPPLFLTLEPPPVAPVAPPPSRPAPSSVSHVTPHSSPPQRPVPVVSEGAGGAVAKGEGTGAA
ncbi:unnamed protein product [Closterium sp. NIES-54]